MYVGERALETVEALLTATPLGRAARIGVSVSRRGVVGSIERAFGRTCNSFSSSTPVRTLSGLVAISALSLGTPVLAFNEKTGETGYYPITAVHKNIDPDITYLTINDPEQGGKSEFIETTPEHPFYVQQLADTTPRPQPEGHADLSAKWVGAGHLKIGDKIKQADGTAGVIANVVTIQQTQEMFNLTVSEAHTYYVGEQGWLVHNAGTVYPNQMPGMLGEEQKIAKQLGVTPLKPGSAAFDRAIGDGTMKWIVRTDGKLLFVPSYGDAIKHSIASGGKPVLAAGEAEIFGSAKEGYYVGEINNRSGHYKPGISSKETAIQAFKRVGLNPMSVDFFCP